MPTSQAPTSPSDLFNQAVETFQTAIRTGAKVQEESTRRFTELLRDFGSPADWQKNAQSMVSSSPPLTTTWARPCCGWAAWTRPRRNSARPWTATQPQQGRAQVVVSGGEAGPGLQGQVVLVQGFRQAALRLQDQAQVVAGHGLAGVHVQDPTVQRFGVPPERELPRSQNPKSGNEDRSGQRQRAAEVRTNLVCLFAISIIINVGMWLERFVIIIGSMAQDYLPYQWGFYWPTWVEWGIMLGSFCFLFLAFLLFVKFLPSVAMTEAKEEARLQLKPKEASHAP